MLLNIKTTLNAMNQILDIFPSPVYFTKLNIPNFDFNSVEFEESSAGGWISKNQKILDLPDLHQIKQEIHKHVTIFYYETLGFSYDTEPYLVCSWATKHNPGDWANSHIHENSFLSGVVYFDVPSNSGDLSFHIAADSNRRVFPSTISPPIARDTKYNSRDVHVSVSKGLTLLFPSTILHSVSKNLSDQCRYVISFNYFLKGDMGGPTRELSL